MAEEGHSTLCETNHAGAGYRAFEGSKGHHPLRRERQKVALARAGCFNPSLLLLDEPTANIDPHSIQVLESHIKKLNRERDHHHHSNPQYGASTTPAMRGSPWKRVDHRIYQKGRMSMKLLKVDTTDQVKGKIHRYFRI